MESGLLGRIRGVGPWFAAGQVGNLWVHEREWGGVCGRCGDAGMGGDKGEHKGVEWSWMGGWMIVC